jgi:hypothetical protein
VQELLLQLSQETRVGQFGSRIQQGTFYLSFEDKLLEYIEVIAIRIGLNRQLNLK